MINKIYLLFVTFFILHKLTIPASALLTDNGDGTITDSDTNLMWLKDASQMMKTSWDSANNWVNTLTVGGYNDWRLPSSNNYNIPSLPPCKGLGCDKSELGRLFHVSLGNPAGSFINKGPFIIDNFANWFWTSTNSEISAGKTGNWFSVTLLWYFCFDIGNQDYEKGVNSNPLNAWAVRTITVPNSLPDQPTTVSPINLAAGVSLLTNLKGSIFSDPDTDPIINSHVASQWQISTLPFDDINFTPLNLIFDKTTQTLDNSQIFLDPGILNPTTTYSWRVRYRDSINWSEWSNWSVATSTYGPGEQFTTDVDPNDTNSNGIPDTQEVTGSVDLNNDGVDDNSQTTISPLVSVVNGLTLAVETSAGILTMTQTEVPNPTKPADYTFPDGVFNYVIENLTPGQEVEVKFYLSQVFLGTDKWYKFSETRGWVDYTDHIVDGIDTTTITLFFKDGGYGDDDGTANGIIIDPGGPGQNIDKEIRNGDKLLAGYPYATKNKIEGQVDDNCFISWIAEK